MVDRRQAAARLAPPDVNPRYTFSLSARSFPCFLLLLTLNVKHDHVYSLEQHTYIIKLELFSSSETEVSHQGTQWRVDVIYHQGSRSATETGFRYQCEQGAASGISCASCPVPPP